MKRLLTPAADVANPQDAPSDTPAGSQDFAAETATAPLGEPGVAVGDAGLAGHQVLQYTLDTGALSDGGAVAASADWFAPSDSALPSIDFAVDFADPAAPVPDADVGIAFSDEAASGDDAGAAMLAISSAPVSSGTAPAVPWATLESPPAGSLVTFLPDVGFGTVPAHMQDGVMGVLDPGPEGATATTISLAATSGLEPAELACSAAPVVASFVPAIPEASIGANGATDAQVQLALDESGLSVNGTGIKVGVLSDSFNDLGGAATDEADGALPPGADIQVLSDLSSGGTDEGRAMMQIVHDIAPGSSLAFYTAENSEQDFAAGILALAADGCKVICDDVSYFDEPFFQNGVVAQAIQTVEAEGVTYVTAAGNDASDGYQAAWTPISGSFDGTRLIDAESFGGSLVQTITVGTSSTNNVPLLLEWNQAYGDATSDLEILVFSGGKLLGTATNSGDGEPTNPWIGLDLGGGATYQIAIENLSGADPGLIKEITEGNGLPVTISGANSGTVYGHAMTPGAITAGVVSAADTPAFGFTTPVSESFSSSGADTELLFANNGTPLSSPDVLTPIVVSGVDDIDTTLSGGLSDFYGTSAASASLAGVAALILSANPNLTPAQVEQIMEETALPMANSAVSGAGLVQADPAVADALPPMVIEADGSTSLSEASAFYYLDGSGGSGPSLKFDGASVVAGEFAPWTPIGAEQTGSGYDVAWKIVGSDVYAIWSTDSSGDYITNITGDVSGTSLTLESYESIFKQDLNGDGTIGPPTTVIEADGSTSLKEIGSEFYQLAGSGGTGPELEFGGAAVVAGQFAPWTPIGAERTSNGYDVAWKLGGADVYSIWTTDGNGNYVSNPIGDVSGTSAALESYETIFQQDLNGDGVIGPAGAIIEAHGATTLTVVGNEFYQLVGAGGSGPELEFGGAAVTVSQFAPWTPIGAEQTSSGYDIAWKVTGSDEYAIWSANSSGNYIANITGDVSGSSSTLESYESIFHQDLNGDGVIGLPTTVIEANGSTSLTEVGNQFYEMAGTGGSGPELEFDGAAVVPGQFAPWTPIGAERTTSGYDVAWQVAGSDIYAIWSTDSNGNYITNITGDVSGTSATLESYESIFHQDLNGDGVIGSAGTSSVASQMDDASLGAAAPAAVEVGATLEIAGADAGSVTFEGSTGTLSLDDSAAFSGHIFNFAGDGTPSGSDQIDLKDILFGSVSTAAFTGNAGGGTLTIDDAQHDNANISLTGDYANSTFSFSDDGNGGTLVVSSSSGHDLASGTLSFNDPDSTGSHAVSVSPQNGGAGFVGSFTIDAAVLGNNAQDTVGWHFNLEPGSITQSTTQSYNVTLTDAQSNGVNSTATQSVSVTIGATGHDTFAFNPGLGTDIVANAISSDTIELNGFSSVQNITDLQTMLAEAQNGQQQSLFQTANGGHDTVINLGNHDSITLENVALADLHASNFVVHPPII